jgi:hypothetical protein
MAKDPAFLFYSQDFIVGVQTMTHEDRGKYITILCQMHQQGRLDEQTIRFLVGSVSDKLKAKFRIDEKGMWYNERLEMETARRNNFTESRRLNGNLGGRPKKSKASAKPNGKPKPNHKQNHTPNRMGNEDVIENDNVIHKKSELVFPFESERFIQAWAVWKEYRNEIKKPYRSKLSEQAALKKLSEHPEDIAIQMIENSISNQWQGLFELIKNGQRKSITDSKSRIDEIVANKFGSG